MWQVLIQGRQNCCQASAHWLGALRARQHAPPASALVLSSVDRPCRQAGIGTELVQQLVSTRGQTPEIWLVTPSYRTNFYERAGFKAVPPWQVPGCAVPAARSVFDPVPVSTRCVTLQHLRAARAGVWGCCAVQKRCVWNHHDRGTCTIGRLFSVVC